MLGLIIGLFCCEGNKNPDVSNIEVDLNLVRFDRLLFALDSTNMASSYQELENDHPAFTELFFNHILPIKSTFAERQAQDFESDLIKFINDDFCRSLYDTTQIVYPDLDAPIKEITQMLKYAKFYFPDVNIKTCLLYTSPSPRDRTRSRMPSSA